MKIRFTDEERKEITKVIDRSWVLIEEQKIMRHDDDKWYFTEAFCNVVTSVMEQNQHDYATGLTRAIKSYCPDLNITEQAAVCTTIVQTLALKPYTAELVRKIERDAQLEGRPAPDNFIMNLLRKMNRDTKGK